MNNLFSALEYATKKAQSFIKKHNINTPVDFEKISKKLDIGIEYINFEDDISGLIKKSGKNGKPIIAVNINKNHSKNRQRFTVAHELGHLLLHAVNPLHVDPRNIFYRDKESSNATKIKEMQANRFAAELLMPSVEVEEDVNRYLSDPKICPDDFIESMADNYKVSTEAMSVRLSKYLEELI